MIVSKSVLKCLPPLSAFTLLLRTSVSQFRLLEHLYIVHPIILAVRTTKKEEKSL